MLEFSKNRIVLIHSNDGTDVRVGKVSRSLSKMGFDTHFIGWDRRPQLEKTLDLGNAQMHLLTRETPFGKPTATGILRFAWHIAKTLARLRPETVCCVNEDNVLLALPMRRLFYRHLVCDVFDALCDRNSHRSWPVRNALSVVEHISRMGADRLIATDTARFSKFGRYKPKCIVVENYPEDPGEDLANTTLDGPMRIYVAGTMHLRRGLRQLIAAVDAAEDIEIVSAGWLFDDYARDVFAKHPKVSFHGIVTASESLRLAAQCDAIFSFYEPSSVNNRQASPNKVYDAMSVGRPVIINEEAGVSQWVVDNHVGLRLPYFDVEVLRRVLKSLKGQRGSLPDFARHARQLFNQGYSWENMEPRLEELYRSLL